MAVVIYDYLSDAEKNEILASRIKSIEYTIYNLEASKIELAATSSENAATVDEIDSQITMNLSKKEILKQEKAKLILE